jgi:hypothetical protein
MFAAASYIRTKKSHYEEETNDNVTLSSLKSAGS